MVCSDLTQEPEISIQTDEPDFVGVSTAKETSGVKHNPYYLRPAREKDLAYLEAIEQKLAHDSLSGATIRDVFARQSSSFLLAARAPRDDELAEPLPTHDGLRQGFMSKLKALVSQDMRKQQRPSNEVIAGVVELNQITDEEAYVPFIGVLDQERQRGVGELLLIGIIEAIQNSSAQAITLEVEITNTTAQNLYAKYKFSQQGTKIHKGKRMVLLTTPKISTKEYHRVFYDLVREHEERWGISNRVLP